MEVFEFEKGREAAVRFWAGLAGGAIGGGFCVTLGVVSKQ